MQIAPVPVGSRGADMVTVLTSSTAAGLKALGYDFVVRYLGGLSFTELSEILSAGLGCQLVTYSRAPGWLPTAAMGASDGANDVAQLKALGVPEGVLLWIDLEGSGDDATDTAGWVEARAAAIVAAGYVAGLYVGSGCVLDGPQLYALGSVTRYWRAYNAGIPEPDPAGFCQYQLFPGEMTVGGVLVDIDFAQQDYKGRVPIMLIQ
jgi:hypothetical protein